jgi:hypothetical protein
VKFPFGATFRAVSADSDRFVDAVFSCLESEFLVLPKGPGFVEYGVFERGYEALKQATSGFSDISSGAVIRVAREVPVAFIVLRSILGFSPPEWAYVASQRFDTRVDQGFVRSLDRKIRLAPLTPLKDGVINSDRVKAFVKTACQLLTENAPIVEADKIHRLDKADTKTGANGIRALAGLGVPYAMLLYERFLGRPFAGHRDSVSELIGDNLESAIEDVLVKSEISYRKTKRAERISGFDQTPDFIVPDEFSPQVVIEAKVTEDDGTARDKITRIQHLGALSLEGRPRNKPKFEVIAYIAGRGFGVRREDMKKLILATRGKVFTLKTLDRLVACSRLSGFRTKGP